MATESGRVAAEYLRTLADLLATLPRHGADPERGDLPSAVLDQLRTVRTIGPRAERLAGIVYDVTDGQGWIGGFMRYALEVAEGEGELDDMREDIGRMREVLAG